MGEVKPAGLQSDWALLEQEGDVDYIWEKVQQVIRECVDTTKFTTWFEPLKPLAFSEGTLQVAVPNKFVRSWLMEHYHTLVSETLQELLGVACQVAFIVDDRTAPPAESRPAASPDPLHHTVVVNGRNGTTSSMFNPRFTFDTFVVGSSNEFAHAACMAVARHPARTYNPLFIYGDVGLGKTHLLHAVANYILRHHSVQGQPLAAPCLAVKWDVARLQEKPGHQRKTTAIAADVPQAPRVTVEMTSPTPAA